MPRAPHAKTSQGSDDDPRAALAGRMAAYYRSNAGYHQSVTEIAGERPGPEERELFEKIAEAVPREHGPMRVLEIGCGRAESAGALSRALDLKEYVGLDPSATALRDSRASNPGHRLLVGDGTALPFHDEVFDACLLSYVLEHCVFPDRMLREAVRVLRPGGVVGLIVPVSDLPWLLPSSLRHRSGDRAFVLRTALSRWAEALRVRHSRRYFAFRTVDEPWALVSSRLGLAQPDDDLVYWGWSHEIEKYLVALGCEVAHRRGRDIRSYIANGRRPAVDLLREVVFFVYRMTMHSWSASSYSTTVSIVARKNRRAGVP